MQINETERRLIDAALAARSQAHAPYSGYRVGAALLDEHGNIYHGCNVENAAYPLAFCAEANAIGSMISAGGRRIKMLLITGGGEALELCPPCGGCRQRIQEFADENTQILLVDRDEQLTTYLMKDLLPLPFSDPTS